MSKNIVCIGSAALDYVFLLDSFPVPDQISLAHWSKQFCGGSSANVVVGVSRLGLHATLISKVGKDSEGALLLNKLISEAVDITYVKISGKTARTVVLLDKKGEKAIITDTECVLKKDDELPESCIQGAKALYIGDCFMPVAEKAVRLAQKMGITSFLRVKNVHAPFGEDLEKVMNNADYVIMNEKTSALIKRSESTIITRGKKGCQCGDIIVKGIPITSRDTTGAGDAFCAGFMYQIVKGSPLEKALKFGNAAAAVSTTVYGAMDSMPSREAVESLLYMV